MLKLLGRATSGNVQKVVFLLEQLGINYQREDYGRQFDNTGGKYLELNPNGTVPTLVDGELVIWESNTILRYLAAREHSKLLPSDLAARTMVERWMDWLLAALNSHYVAVFKGSKLPEEKRGSSFAVSAQEVSKLLALLDNHLSKRSWLAGEEFSLADIALGPIVHRCLGFPIERPQFRALENWHRQLQKIPAFGKAVGDQPPA